MIQIHKDETGVWLVDELAKRKYSPAQVALRIKAIEGDLLVLREYLRQLEEEC